MSPRPDSVCVVDAAPKLDEAEVGRIFREESGRSVATLTRIFGDIDVAEDAVQEAFTVALRKWAGDGLPPNPGGWITTTGVASGYDPASRVEVTSLVRSARHALATGFRVLRSMRTCRAIPCGSNRSVCFCDHRVTAGSCSGSMCARSVSDEPPPTLGLHGDPGPCPLDVALPCNP
jgi:hypothetical protein